MEKQKKKNINFSSGIKVFLIFIIIWFLGNGIVSMAMNSAVQTLTLETQIDEKTITTYGVLEMSEVLLLATETGQAVNLQEEGTRVRSGNAVFQVNNKTVYAPVAGLLSYKIDGYEQIGDLTEILARDLETAYEEQTKKEQTATVEKDQAYCKLINSFDNVNLCVVAPVSPYINRLKEEDKLKFRLLDSNIELSGVITETIAVSDYEKGFKVDLGCPRQEVFERRIHRVEIYYDSREVIKIPEKALVKHEGIDGVYILDKGFVLWKPISVVSECFESKELIVNGLEKGNTIITTPSLVKEGENIKH